MDNIYQFGMNSATFSYGGTTVTNTSGNQFLFKFDANGNAIMGYALQNTSFDRTIVTPEGKLVSGGTYTAEGSAGYGNIYLIKFSNYLNAEWQKVSSNSLAGTARIINIKHDDSGNTYIQSRIIGNCNYFGTSVNSNKSVTVISKHDITGNLLWMKQIPDVSPSQIGQAFTIDKDNNILTVGLFKSSLDIGNTTLTSANTGNEGYVAKYSTDGTFQWAETFDLGADVSNSITLSSDKAGDVIVALVKSPANYLLKFSGSGSRLWTKSFPMESYYLALVSTDAANNIYLASEIHLDNTTGTATIGTMTLNQSVSDGSSALIKFDPDGNTIWAKTYGSIAGASYTDGWPGDVVTDDAGNTYMYGWCPNNAAFGTTTLTNPLTSDRTYLLYLTKINTTGDVLWAKAVYQKMSTYGYGDLLDLDKQGNVYLGGHFKDKINIDGTEYTPSGTTDFFTVKFSNSGDFKWIKTIPNNSAMTSISVMDDNIVSVAGDVGKNTMLGNFDIIQKGGSSCIVATMVLPNVMSGHITDHTASPVTSGFVKLYKLNGNLAATMVDSVAIQADGSYTLQNIPNSDFILYAEAASQLYPDYIGTYSGNVALWSAASILNFTTSVQSDYDIELLMIPVITGSGQITGTVIYDNSSNGKSSVKAGSPLVSVPVILVDKNAAAGTDSIVAIVMTNNLGEYMFSNVPAGNYAIRVEIPGLDMIERHEVELTAAKPDAEKMNYLVTNTGIIIDNSTVTGISKGENNRISIYPNPAKSIVFVSGINQNSVVSIFDSNGRMIMSKRIAGNQVDISKLAKGIYSLKVTDNKGVSVTKLVKQ